MPTQPNEPAALILRAADTPFTDAVVLGQGLPLEKEGHTITSRVTNNAYSKRQRNRA